MPRHRRLLAAFALTTALASPALTQSYTIEPLAEGLNQPWALAFLPGTPDILLTGKTGQIMIWEAGTGTITAIDGAPEVDARGQGGLLDIAPAPDFEHSALVYLTWSTANDAGETATHLGRARLDREAARLNGLEVLHAVEPFMDAPGHYGSRIIFADEHLYFSTGDRQQKNFGPGHIAQNLSTGYGSVLRLNLDGSPPSDNPFADDDGAAPEIWSFGHRNIQAMTVHPRTGAIWVAEHGEAGGDEINIVERGGNYGWPLVSHGVDYRTGEPFAPEHAADDAFIAPVFHFGPGRADNFPPSGMAFYEGAAFPEWQGSLLIGNLAHEYLGRFPTDGDAVSTPERLLEGQGWRIRDVAVGPQDGFVYVISDGEEAVLARLVPAAP
ncbi:MAG TPA: PQQ-dependent sugar dehydrogenase [Paracoccus sp.]|nr:PQQ-dependent sugar dehydrogenase [Paracoccus sp. (in: a-proteobacteria)]